ncbi:MAG: ABC transporter permease [Thauera sp.]|nr:ABC transporter permease [Thauera sp.]
MLTEAGAAGLEFSAGDGSLRLQGAWTLANYRRLAAESAALQRRHGAALTTARVDGSGLEALDTAGATLLQDLLGSAGLNQVLAQGPQAGFSAGQLALLRTVQAALTTEEKPAVRSGSALGDVLEHVGKSTLVFLDHILGIAGFIGLVLQTWLKLLPRPWRWRWTSLMANLEHSGFHAVPIIALLTFLVGAVVAFLGATVLTTFGASIFTVDLIAYSFLREFGVLLAAIIVAGRTASAFTAQIGSMRANEEVDAIRVLGLDPVELLVLPRVSALLIALPLLTFVAMISGIAGGLVVCMLKLDISAVMFFSVIDNNIDIRHFWIGMAKAPIFAFLIAIIGCLEGFRVSGSAQSVGEHTTSAVVQSIFIVIVIDAVAALFCMEMGW